MKQREGRLPKDAKPPSGSRPGRAVGDRSGNSSPIATWFLRWKDWLAAIALAAVVFAAYQPAWEGGFVWDDDAHVRPDLQSWNGLYRIWFDINATQQYYPLLHSAFWLEYRLWGRATLGYHLVNIALHIVVALLVAAILRRLKVPGAYLAAAIFSLHPVHVESVAWITELKNGLSGAFYLSAALVYLNFDQDRKRRWYFFALGLFALGLLSKTVTATLPAALLVVFWWQRGRLSWRRDVLPLLPFFVLGAVAGVCTAVVERKLGGAEGAEFDFTIVERCLIAGRAIWFYLGKLFWPADLIFIYPRWHVSQTVWWQYVFPLAALLLPAGLWAIRRRWRGPLAALLFFAGTLFPVLGFCNVYPFLFSFVADHFQYLASLGIITLVSAGVALLFARWRFWGRWPAYCLCVPLLMVLATLTWKQCWTYYNVVELYATTIKGNPDCWLAYNNLGLVLADCQQYDDAIECYRNALKIKPHFEKAHLNLGVALVHCHRLDDAMTEYRAALAINPDYAEAHYNIGIAHMTRQQLTEAMADYQKALDLKPSYAEAHCNLGLALATAGRTGDAIAEYEKALQIKPDYAGARCNLANALLVLRRYDEAIAEYRKAIAIRPDFVEAKRNLETILSHLEELRAKGAPQNGAE
jgi:protein O-mannosyl-transferase